MSANYCEKYRQMSNKQLLAREFTLIGLEAAAGIIAAKLVRKAMKGSSEKSKIVISMIVGVTTGMIVYRQYSKPRIDEMGQVYKERFLENNTTTT